MVGDLLGAKGSHVVIGDSAGHDIDGQQNIAIGYKTGKAVKSDHNVAIGSEAGTNIGSTGNTSEGKNVSIGYHANKNDAPVSRIQSTAIGSETIAADDAVAIKLVLMIMALPQSVLTQEQQVLPVLQSVKVLALKMAISLLGIVQ